MNLHLLTTPWQRALGAMFRDGLGDSELVFLYPYSAPRLFHTCFCPPLRLTALSEDGEIIFSRVIAPWRFVRLPPTRLVLETAPAASLPSRDERRALHRLPVSACSASWDETVPPDRLVVKMFEQAVADMRRVYEAHRCSGPVCPDVLRTRFAPWERGDFCTAAITILDGAGMVPVPEPAISFSYQLLQAEKPHLEELAAASLAGQPWKADFPLACLRCAKPGSWRQALRSAPGLAVETAWRYERPENAVPLCKRCAYRLEWSRRESLIRDDLDWQQHVEYIHYNPVKHGLVHAPVECGMIVGFRSALRASAQPTDYGLVLIFLISRLYTINRGTEHRPVTNLM